ncbi:MAG: DUF4332 domain-containing protein [candidate division KSB1 bacterium]|nr:DUF4332 domain-containing protein [candidate division KSB1 bacterium]
MKSAGETANEWAERFAARPEFEGDPETLRRGMAAAGTPRSGITANAAAIASDPMLHVAFQPTDREQFEQACRNLLPAVPIQTERAGIVSREAVPEIRISLFLHLPGGVAHLPASLFMKLLDAGLIRSFSWEPPVRLTSAAESPATPLSAVGDAVLEERLRSAGIASALDLVSKASDPLQRTRLAAAVGVDETELKRILAKVKGQLSESERKLIASPPPFPFIPGIPLTEK